MPEQKIHAQDWMGDPGGFKTPEEPFVSYIEFTDHRITYALRSELCSTQRAVTVLDAIALCVNYPEVILPVVQNQILVLAGTQDGGDGVACLDWDGEKPWIHGIPEDMPIYTGIFAIGSKPPTPTS